MSSGASMGGGDYFKGWIPLSNHTQWVPPFRHPDSEDVVANDADWPSVEWPHYEGSQTGEGDKGDYHIGVGGYCQDDLQDPLVGSAAPLPSRSPRARAAAPCVLPLRVNAQGARVPGRRATGAR